MPSVFACECVSSVVEPGAVSGVPKLVPKRRPAGVFTRHKVSALCFVVFTCFSVLFFPFISVCVGMVLMCCVWCCLCVGEYVVIWEVTCVGFKFPFF